MASWPWLYLGGNATVRIDLRTGQIMTAGASGYLVLGQDGKVYAYAQGSGQNDTLEALDPVTLQVLRQVQAPVQGSDSFPYPPVALPDGRVAIQDFWGTLILYKPTADGKAFKMVWAVPLRDTADGWAPIYDPKTGIIVAPVARGFTPGDSSAESTVGVRVSDGKVLWSAPGIGSVTPLPDSRFVREGVEPGPSIGLELRSTATGDLLGGASTTPTSNYLNWVDASADGTRIYWVHDPPSDYDATGKQTTNGALMAFDGALNHLWTWHIPGPIAADGSPVVISAPPAVSPDGSVTVTANNCTVYHLGRTGKLRWYDRSPYEMNRDVDPGFPRPVAVGDMVVLGPTTQVGSSNCGLGICIPAMTMVNAYHVALQQRADGGVGDAGTPSDGGLTDAGVADGSVGDGGVTDGGPVDGGTVVDAGSGNAGDAGAGDSGTDAGSGAPGDGGTDAGP